MPKFKLPSKWVRYRAQAYITDGETVESAFDHAIMDYLDYVYTHEADFLLEGGVRCPIVKR